ncbi:AGE family epimerase/isomerase [Jiella mangrovi]|uniref:AGE family epimerase/isomerase n=1 Tax=Jiella mangrovi TaxID=2821407 RepID=A0ABS4BLP0_9HYPH|nr:AGE family epimerase/isomerase [Jiella mangrovi]MBP0617596.1 AGE family epimerase/isomerase [Jiella mangrovi]
MAEGADVIAPIAPKGGSWITSARHRRWLSEQGQRLLDFSKESRLPVGFGSLDTAGQMPDDATPDLVVTARMTHSYALGALQGLPGSAPLVDHGLTALTGSLKDHENGGWDDGSGRKQAYAHAFVALAAASAHVAGRPGAKALLEEIVTILETRFWSEEEGVMRESFAPDWSDEEDYRGANANMHSVEVSMALADVLDAPVWRERALRIVTRFVHEIAAEQNFRIVEHFDRNWTILKDYNKDTRDDDLRPYGMTPGHFVEWSHLLLKLEAALLAQGEGAPDWMLGHAESLFAAGMRDGWKADGNPGLVYTIGWDGRPSVRNRAHWAQAEAITAAAGLLKRTGRTEYERWYRTLWDYLDLHVIDRRCGSWHNEVDGENAPSEQIYRGKPDLYHAYQSTLTPVLPLAPFLAVMLERTEAIGPVRGDL